MGYSESRKLVRENKALLEQILDAAERGETIHLDLERVDDLNSWEYKMHRLLASTELYRDEFDGRYVGLRSAVAVKKNKERISIDLVPKSASGGDAYNIAATIGSGDPTETELLVEMEKSEATLLDRTIRLKSLELDQLLAAIEVNPWGWEVVKHTDLGKSQIRLILERPEVPTRKKVSPFDLIGRK